MVPEMIVRDYLIQEIEEWEEQRKQMEVLCTSYEEKLKRASEKIKILKIALTFLDEPLRKIEN